MRFPNNEFYLKRSQEEMSRLFADLPEAIENSNRIARRCQVSFDLKIHLPQFELPPGETAGNYLRSLCMAGMEKIPNPDQRFA